VHERCNDETVITRDSAAATEERSNQASHLEYPYLLRRAPAILAALLTLIIGSALLIVAAHLHDSHPFASGVFVNVSSPVLLFAPLAFLTTTFGRQIVRSENARNVKIEQLKTQVKNVREDFDSALGAIAHGVTERMAADRKPIEDDIRAIVQAPMSHSIGNALRHGIENGYLSSLQRSGMRPAVGWYREPGCLKARGNPSQPRSSPR